MEDDHIQRIKPRNADNLGGKNPENSMKHQ